MSYPHVQGAMSTSHGYEPKFPPSETDFHHLHHHHSGYGAMNGIAATTNHMDYNYHNGYNYNYATPSPSTPFYHPHHHHPHPPYGSPQTMHHPTNTPSPNIPNQQQSTTSSYATNVLTNNSNNSSTQIGSRNNSIAPQNASSSNGSSAGLVNSLNIASDNTTTSVDGMGYYNNYYATTNLPHDLPLQCHSAEPPANTALGLQELGKYRTRHPTARNLFLSRFQFPAHN
jgi:homeobox protein HoxA/B/C/D4